MTRRETTLLKGVAILMMLFLHLFNTDFKIGLCQIGIDIAGIPLLSLLVRAANPVAFLYCLADTGFTCLIVMASKIKASALLSCICIIG